MPEDQNEHDSWLERLGVTGFKSADAYDSTVSGEGSGGYSEGGAYGGGGGGGEVYQSGGSAPTYGGGGGQSGYGGGGAKPKYGGGGKGGSEYGGGAQPAYQEQGGGYGGAPGQPMQPDCYPVHGKVPGPNNHLLCQTHGHVLDVSAKVIIANSLEEYKQRYPKGGGGGAYGKGKDAGYGGSGGGGGQDGYGKSKPGAYGGGGEGGYGGGGATPNYGGGGGKGGYQQQGGGYGGAPGQPMQPDCYPVHGKVPGPTNHLLCSTHGHVLDVSAKVIIANSLDEYKKRYPYAKGKGGGGGAYGKPKEGGYGGGTGGQGDYGKGKAGGYGGGGGGGGGYGGGVGGNYGGGEGGEYGGGGEVPTYQRPESARSKSGEGESISGVSEDE